MKSFEIVVYNHHAITVLYQRVPFSKLITIVGFEITPMSINSKENCSLPGNARPLILKRGGSSKITWTYSLQWKHVMYK
jgi:hypothetical protein